MSYKPLSRLLLVTFVAVTLLVIYEGRPSTYVRAAEHTCPVAPQKVPTDARGINLSGCDLSGLMLHYRDQG